MKLRSAVFGLLAIAFLLPNAFAITSVHAPAVDTNGNGVLTSLEANAIQGDGDIFVDIQPFISVDTQQSAKTAVEIAAQEAGVNAKKYDVLFKILARTQIIDGPPRGAGLKLFCCSALASPKTPEEMVRAAGK